MRRAPLFLVAAVALPLVMSGGAAQAATRTFSDAKGDVSNSNDVVTYTVTNGKKITVTTKSRHLTKQAVDIQFLLKSSSSTQVFTAYSSLDGKAQYVGQVGSGDYAPCRGMKVSRSLAKGTASLSVPRTCLASPKGRIKVRVRLQWSLDGAKGDWAPNTGYSPWVGR